MSATRIWPRGRGFVAMRYWLKVPILALIIGCGGSGGGSLTGAGESGAGAPAAGQETTDEKRVIRIMAVGDSITHGVADPTPSASWRLPFTLGLDQDECAYEMVGSQDSNDSHDAFLSSHESYSAHQAGHFLTGFTNWAGSNEGIYRAMQSYKPDVVLLHIGTNDAIRSQANTGTIQEIDQIVATVLDADSDVLIANVIPTFANDIFEGVDARIKDLGDRIEAYVTQLGNERVQLVDVRNGFTPEQLFEDGIHPNDQGSQVIADAFYKAYKANDYCD